MPRALGLRALDWVLLTSAFVLALAAVAWRRIRHPQGRRDSDACDSLRRVDALLGADTLLLAAAEIRRSGGPKTAVQALVLHQADSALAHWRTRAAALRFAPAPGALAAPALALAAAVALWVATLQHPLGHAPLGAPAGSGTESAPPPAALAQLRTAIARAAEKTPQSATAQAEHLAQTGERTSAQPSPGDWSPVMPPPSIDVGAIPGAIQPDDAGQTHGLALAGTGVDGFGSEVATASNDTTPLRQLPSSGAVIPLARAEIGLDAGASAPAERIQEPPSRAASARATTALPSLRPVLTVQRSAAPMDGLSLHQRGMLAAYHRYLAGDTKLSDVRSKRQ
ncbi:hypothetical protein [Thiohalocapsa halophila]|nr:hypothetical protein [Thiohalocapsa halophila]